MSPSDAESIPFWIVAKGLISVPSPVSSEPVVATYKVVAKEKDETDLFPVYEGGHLG